MTVVVKRSAAKMWLLAMAGVPLLIIAADVLTNRRMTNWLREIVFRPEDTQIYEPRDVIWAWVMLLFAGFLVVWGLKELFVPTKIVECGDEGLSLKINGPFRWPTIVPWTQIVDVKGSEVIDEGTRVPILSIRLLSREGVPEDPWGARWIGSNELAVLAEEWGGSPHQIADQIGDYAVEAAKRAASVRISSTWSEEE